MAADLAKVYDTVLSGQPGFFARDDDWWERVLDDPAEERQGRARCAACWQRTATACAATRSTGARARWEEGTVLPDGAINVWELVAADPAASAALWRDLLSRDLITSVTADLRPADDPLLYQLHDSRRARVRLADNLWVRIIDLPAALARRAYSSPVDVVLEVTDELLPANAGRWRLRAARARRPRRLHADRRAGRHRAGRQGARRGLPRRHPARRARRGRPGQRAAAGRGGRLSTAMSWDPAPWCPRIF